MTQHIILSGRTGIFQRTPHTLVGRQTCKRCNHLCAVCLLLLGLDWLPTHRFFNVWDQTSNLILSSYTAFQVTDKYLGACNATTKKEACPMFNMSFCTYNDYSTDLAYTLPGPPNDPAKHRNGAGDSLDRYCMSHYSTVNTVNTEPLEYCNYRAMAVL